MRNMCLYEEQKQYTENLEQKVLERTAELENMQQSQKQSMLDISHGLQGPLTLLRAEIETAQIQQNPTRRKLEACIKMVDKTSATAYELVTLARLNTLTKGVPSPQKISCDALLQKALSSLKQSALSKGVTITSSVEKDISIQGSSGDIHRLIMNVVKNAIKYTALSQAAPKDICITLTKNTQTHTTQFTVTDTGIGIPKAALPKLFDTFYRVDDTVAVDGTGIGLTICKRIVEAHNGTITVESTLHKGSTFTVTLPLE